MVSGGDEENVENTTREKHAYHHWSIVVISTHHFSICAWVSSGAHICMVLVSCFLRHVGSKHIFILFAHIIYIMSTLRNIFKEIISIILIYSCVHSHMIYELFYFNLSD